MRVELDVEREVGDDELARAIAKALPVDRERLEIESHASPGDFARRVAITGPDASIDRIAFYRALAQLLDSRLLVDDEGAMLVTPAGETVRVKVDDRGAIVGLREYAETDEVPDRLVLESTIYRRTKGQELAQTLHAISHDLAAFAPDVQDAEHTLTELLRELVHRKPTPDDERALRRTCAVLRRAVPEDAGGSLSDIVRCAAGVLAAPWDPDDPA